MAGWCFMLGQRRKMTTCKIHEVFLSASAYLDTVGVEYEAREGTALDVHAAVHDGDGPLARLVWLEGGAVHASVLVHRAVQLAARGRPRHHADLVGVGAI